MSVGDSFQVDQTPGCLCTLKALAKEDCTVVSETLGDPGGDEIAGPKGGRVAAKLSFAILVE